MPNWRKHKFPCSGFPVFTFPWIYVSLYLHFHGPTFPSTCFPMPVFPWTCFQEPIFPWTYFPVPMFPNTNVSLDLFPGNCASQDLCFPGAMFHETSVSLNLSFPGPRPLHVVHADSALWLPFNFFVQQNIHAQPKSKSHIYIFWTITQILLTLRMLGQENVGSWETDTGKHINGPPNSHGKLIVDL